MKIVLILSLLIHANLHASLSFTDKTYILGEEKKSFYEFNEEIYQKKSCFNEESLIKSIESFETNLKETSRFDFVEEKVFFNQFYFFNESKLALDLFSSFFTQLDARGFNEVGPNPIIQKLDETSCLSPYCYMENYFGKEVFSKLFYLKSNFNINASFLRFQDYTFEGRDDLTFILKPFLSEELNDLIIGSSLYPKYLQNYNQARETHAMRFTKKYKDPISVANARMMYFDLWSESKPWYRQYAVMHELAHRLGGHFELDESDEWKELSLADQKNYKNKAPNCITRYIKSYIEDGKEEKGVNEDFAESVVLFRFDSDYMLLNCPAKFEMIKETVFRGQDYLKVNQSCDDQNQEGREYQSVKEEVKLNVSNFIDGLEGSKLKAQLTLCNSEKYFLGEEEKYFESLSNCIVNKNYKNLNQVALEKSNFKYKKLMGQVLLKDQASIQNTLKEKLQNFKEGLKNHFKKMLIKTVYEVSLQKNAYMGLYVSETPNNYCINYLSGSNFAFQMIFDFERRFYNKYSTSFLDEKVKVKFANLGKGLCENHQKKMQNALRQNKKFIPDIKFAQSIVETYFNYSDN